MPRVSRDASEQARWWYRHYAHRYDRANLGIPGDTAFYARLCAAERVVEIGAGTGRVTLAVAGGAARVFAVEREPTMLVHARRATPGLPVQLLLADARCLPIASGTVTRVLLPYRTLQQVGDETARRVVLAEARRVLSPQGILALDTWHGPVERRSDRLPWIEQVSPVDVERALRDGGFERIQVWGGFNGEAVMDACRTRVWVAHVSAGTASHSC